MSDQDKREKQENNVKATEPKKIKRQIPDLKSGQRVRVHQKIKEGKKERVQIFEGIIIAIKGQDAQSRTITVQKTSGGVLVEKIFPLALPTIEKIEIVSELDTNKSKLYYLKNYKKKIKEKKV